MPETDRKVETDELLQVLCEHDNRTVSLLEAIVKKTKDNEKVMDKTQRLLNQSALNLCNATKNIDRIANTQVVRDEWAQKEISKNSEFMQKVIWKVVAVMSAIVLAASGLQVLAAKVI